MKIGSRTIAPDRPPYIIAEIGVNHDGSLERAFELTQAAAEAGADAIKLQYFEAHRLLSKAARPAEYQRRAGMHDPVEMLRRLELSKHAMTELVAEAHKHHVHAIVTLFSVEHVEPAERFGCDAYKTASPDIHNRPLIEALIATGRPLILSTGAASLHEVDNARLWIGEHAHVFMQCVSAYPTPDECAALGARIAIEHIDACAIGYSDHTAAVDTGALAVASGARMLEKHLTYDRAARGPDHAASLDPQQFAEYVRLAHRAAKMLGEPEKKVLDIEQDVRDVSRQSITTLRALDAGHVVSPGDLTIKRPGSGLAPHRMADVIGRRLARSVEEDMPLHEDDLA